MTLGFKVSCWVNSYPMKISHLYPLITTSMRNEDMNGGMDGEILELWDRITGTWKMTNDEHWQSIPNSQQSMGSNGNIYII